MGIFDFFKSNSKKLSIDLTDYKFISDDHTRIQNGQTIVAENKGAWRGIWIKTSDHITFYVTMYNMDGSYPFWGDNIQMTEKQMKLVDENATEVTLRGFGTDVMGTSFADYGLTLHKLNGSVNKITLHMHDRNVHILYEKAESNERAESLNQISDFDSFKEFTHKWQTSMNVQDKMEIANQSDILNNRGADVYDEGDLIGAINYFEQALRLMPNNDDSLKNLKLCYSEIGNQPKAKEVENKLRYLS